MAERPDGPSTPVEAGGAVGQGPAPTKPAKGVVAARKKAATQSSASGAAVRRTTGLGKARPRRPAPPPLVDLHVVQAWGLGVLNWIRSEAALEPGTVHLPDALAAWIGTLRIAGTERGWSGNDMKVILGHVQLLARYALPALVDRVGTHPRDQVAVALLQLELAMPDTTPAQREAADLVWSALLHLTRTDAASRDAALMWADTVGARMGPARRRALAPVPGPTAGTVAAVSGVAVDVDTTTLGLFEGIDAEAIRAAEQVRETVRSTIERAIGAIGLTEHESFVVELLVEDEPVTYAQALIEDADTLHLEVGHPELLELGPSPDRLRELARMGWLDPEPDLPNPWRQVAREGLDPAEVAELLVESMEVAHGAFLRLPANAMLGVKPIEVGMAVMAGHAEPHTVEFGDGKWVLMQQYHPTVHVIDGLALGLVARSLKVRLERPHFVVRTEEMATLLLLAATTRQRLLASRGAPAEARLEGYAEVARRVLERRPVPAP